MSQTKAQLIDNLVQPITGALGSASAPTFSFTSDPNTGLYSPGADQVAISTNGTGRLFIDSSGRLLEGTSTARTASGLSAYFQLEGTTAEAGSASIIRNGGNPYFGLFRTGSASLGSVTAVGANAGLAEIDFGASDGTTVATGAYILAANDSGSAWTTSSHPTRLAIFTTADSATSPTERLRIDSSGRVGIGTSSPGKTLDVNGSFRQSGGEFLIEPSASNTVVSIAPQTSTNGAILRFTNGSTTSYFGKENSAGNYTWSSGGTAYATIISAYGSTAPIQFGHNSPSVTLDSSGRLGIGSTSPSTTLSIGSSATGGYNGGVLLNRGASVYNFYEASDGTNTVIFGLDNALSNAKIGSINSYPIGFYTGNVERARIDTSGRLLVGTSSSPSVGDGQYARIVVQGYTGGASGPGQMVFARGEAASSITSDEELGNISFTDSAGYAFARIGCAADAAAGSGDYPGRLTFSTCPDSSATPVERMRINNAGDTGIARGLTVGSTAPLVSNRFCLSASVVFSGAGNSTLKYNTSSGEVTYDTSSRLVKDNIVDCPYGINELKLLQPRKYFRTDDQREEIGFVADELAQVMPEFVPFAPKSVITKEEGDTQQIPIGVNYEKLTAVLTAALQEAIAKIETLEAKVAALEAN